MHVFFVLLLFVATHRVTRLITRDQLFERPEHETNTNFVHGPRTWLMDHIEDKGALGWKVAYLISCDWCSSMYVSGILTTLLALYSTRYMHESWWPWPIWVLVALTGSTVTGLIAQREPD